MKKIGSAVLALVLAAAFTQQVMARGARAPDLSTLTVGATAVPHAELLNLVKEDLAAQGITLKVIEFTDYVAPNEALVSGDLDANFFQHQPYLESNPGWKAALGVAIGVHVEPMGLFSTKITDIADLADGANIAIPNDPTNGGRALLLLQKNGLLKLNPAAGVEATKFDITDNPHSFNFTELEAAQLPRSLDDVDAAVINGNYALAANLNPVEDSLIIEGSDSPYVNFVVVRKGSESDPRIQALSKALRSDKVRAYILSHYDGGVIPIF
jgi:D-methionine transport system substrate-binding protein